MYNLIATEPSDWLAQLQNVFTRPADLLSSLDLTAAQVGYSNQAALDFPLKVPRAFAAKMRAGDPLDPLLLQVLASEQELLQAPGYNHDPVGETAANITQPGVIQKYRGRALLILSGGCAINCRYCFRRHFPYSDNVISRAQRLAAIEEISKDSSITEIILSGGEPLLVGDKQLQELTERIAAVDHIKRLRIHTRLPVVIPERITASLVDAISHPRLATVMVLHSNHANEIDAQLGIAMRLLQQRGITLLNQSVLLAGVNDSAKALVDLSEALFDIGVLPYYLHLLDKVQGSTHFDVPEARATQLMREITAQLPGYLVPKLVREIAGKSSKIGVFKN